MEQVKTGIPFLSKQIPRTYTEPTGKPSRRNLYQYIMPYGAGVREPKYEKLLQMRQKELQLNTLMNKKKRELEEKFFLQQTKKRKL